MDPPEVLLRFLFKYLTLTRSEIPLWIATGIPPWISTEIPLWTSIDFVNSCRSLFKTSVIHPGITLDNPSEIAFEIPKRDFKKLF